MSDKCRLCKSNVEDIHHIASSCPQLSSRYYLPLQHNVIAKCVYNKLLINGGQNQELLQEPDQIYNTNAGLSMNILWVEINGLCNVAIYCSP